MPARQWRVSLSDLMIFVALAAIVLLSDIGRGRPAVLLIPHSAIICVSLAFLVAYRRLSTWAWIVIACQVGTPVSDLVDEWIYTTPEFPVILWGLGGWSLSLAYWVGIGMTLRAAHRRIVDLEARLPGRPAVDMPAGEAIADDIPA